MNLKCCRKYKQNHHAQITLLNENPINPMDPIHHLQVSVRRMWLWATFPIEYYVLHPVDFAVLALMGGSNPKDFTIDKVWFHDTLYDSMDDVIVAYNKTRSVNASYQTNRLYE